MIYLMIALGVWALDYGVKSYVDSHHLQGTRQEYFGGKLIIRNFHNSDGAFGLFKGRRKLGENLAGVTLVCVTWEFLKSLFARGGRLLKLGLALIAGGGACNYADRVMKGYVTDYFSIGVKNKKVRETVFNLSDLFICIGTMCFLISRMASILREK